MAAEGVQVGGAYFGITADPTPLEAGMDAAAQAAQQGAQRIRQTVAQTSTVWQQQEAEIRRLTDALVRQGAAADDAGKRARARPSAAPSGDVAAIRQETDEVRKLSGALAEQQRGRESLAQTTARVAAANRADASAPAPAPTSRGKAPWLPPGGEIPGSGGIAITPGPNRVPITQQTVRERYEGLQARFGTNQEQIERLKQELDERAANPVRRPPWAVGKTDDSLIEVAKRHGVSPFTDGWWESAGLLQGSGEVREDVNQSGVSPRLRTAQGTTALRERLREMQRENKGILDAGQSLKQWSRTGAQFYAVQHLEELPFDTEPSQPEPAAAVATPEPAKAARRPRKTRAQAAAAREEAARQAAERERQMEAARQAAEAEEERRQAEQRAAQERAEIERLQREAGDRATAQQRQRTAVQPARRMTEGAPGPARYSPEQIEQFRQYAARRGDPRSAAEQLARLGLPEDVIRQVTGGGDSGGQPPRPPRNAARGSSSGDGGGSSEDSARRTKDTADASERAARGFNLSNQTLLRMGGALVGVNLGISVAAGLMRDFHQALADAVDTAEKLQQRGLTLAATFGEGASRWQAFARTQGQFPVSQTLGAAQSTQFLTSYGLSADERTSIVRQSEAAARIHNLDAAKLAGQVSQAIESGGRIPEIGLDLSERGLQQAGFQTQGLTAEQLAQARYQAFSQRIRQETDATGGKGTPLSEAQRGLSATGEKVQQNTGDAAIPFVTGAIKLATDLLKPFTGSATSARPQIEEAAARRGVRYDPASHQNVDAETGAVLSAEEAQRRYNAASQDLLKTQQLQAQAAEQDKQATQQQSQAVDQQTSAAQREKQAADAVTAAIGEQAAMRERVLLLMQATEQLAGQHQAIATAALGPEPQFATPAQIAVSARETAAAQIQRQIEARQAAIAPDPYEQQLRQNLVQAQRTAASAPQDAAADTQRAVQTAQADLDSYLRRIQAARQLAEAQQAGARAQAAGATASLEVAQLDLAAQGRRVEHAQELADLTKQRLDLEGQIAPIQRQQADAQARYAVSQQEDLAITKQVIEARQAALRPEAAQQDLSYTQQRLQLQAQSLRVQQIRGTAPADSSQQLADLRARMRQAALDEPDVALAALDAQHAAEVAGRAQTADQYRRQLAGLPYQVTIQQTQQQLLDPEAALRAEQEKEQAIQRQIALQDAEDAPARARWAFAVSQAGLLSQQADEAQRHAQELAAGIDLGATNAERFLNAMKQANDLLGGSLTSGGAARDLLQAGSSTGPGSGAGTHGLKGDYGPAVSVPAPARPVGLAGTVPYVAGTPAAANGGGTAGGGLTVHVGDVTLAATGGSLSAADKRDIAHQAAVEIEDRLVYALDHAAAPASPSLVGTSR